MPEELGGAGGMGIPEKLGPEGLCLGGSEEGQEDWGWRDVKERIN